MTVPVHNSNGEEQNHDEILNRCLRAIERNQATVESCVKQFPEFRELGELLRMSAAIRELPRLMMPAAFTTRTQQQLQAHLRARARAQRASTQRRPLWLRPWLAVSLVLILLVFGGVGLVRASENAMPGDGFLYTVKRTVEGAELLFAPDRADVLLHIAQTRLTEVSTLAARGQPIEEPFMIDLSESVNRATVALSDPAQRAQLADQATRAIRQAQASGSISVQVADNTLSKLAVQPSTPQGTTTATPGTVVQNPTTQVPTTTPTASSTPPPTVTPSQTRSATPTATSTPTMTVKPSETPTGTNTVLPSFTPTPTATLTPTASATQLITTAQVFTSVPTSAALVSPFQTIAAPLTTPVASETPQGEQATVSPTAGTEIPTVAGETPSETPDEATVTPSETPTLTATPTATNTVRPTRTPTSTRTPTPTPTATPTPTPTATSTPEMNTSALPPTSFKQPPQHATFNECPPEGKDGDTELNRNRNRTDEGNFQAVPLDVILGIGWPKEIEGKRHDQWSPGARDAVSRAAGLPVLVEGFVARVDQRGPESANCNSNSDLNLQITVVAQPEAAGDPAKAVVTHITPRVRANHAGWTAEKLNALVGARVQIAGWLLLDPEHGGDVGKSRGTLWEIHPVLQIAVWKDGQWVRLDDYQP